MNVSIQHDPSKPRFSVMSLDIERPSSQAAFEVKHAGELAFWATVPGYLLQRHDWDKRAGRFVLTSEFLSAQPQA